jgi:hypothetical protein
MKALNRDRCEAFFRLYLHETLRHNPISSSNAVEEGAQGRERSCCCGDGPSRCLPCPACSHTNRFAFRFVSLRTLTFSKVYSTDRLCTALYFSIYSLSEYLRGCVLGRGQFQCATMAAVRAAPATHFTLSTHNDLPRSTGGRKRSTALVHACPNTGTSTSFLNCYLYFR